MVNLVNEDHAIKYIKDEVNYYDLQADNNHIWSQYFGCVNPLVFFKAGQTWGIQWLVIDYRTV